MALTLDGTILNIADIAEKLVKAGYSSRATSSNDILLEAFSAFGPAVLSELAGPFALSVLSIKEQRLYIARDGFGLKTVYYHSSDRGFVFSSDLPTVLEWPHIPRTVDPEGLFLFLRHASMDRPDRTLFSSVAQVSPGECLEIDLSSAAVQRRHDFAKTIIPDRIDVSFDEASRQVRDLFLESVQLHQHQASSIGVSLSGGTDSTAIAMSMRRLRSDDAPIDTFSYITPGVDQLNEEPWIDLVNDRANGRPHKVSATSSEFVSDIPNVISNFGEPLAGSSQYVQWKLFQAVERAGVNVTLDGVGGDGLMAGHHYLIVERIYTAAKTHNYKTALKLIWLVFRTPEFRRSRVLVINAMSHLPEAVQHAIRRLIRQEAFPAWLDREWFMERGVYGSLPSPYRGDHALQKHMLSGVMSAKAIRVAERNAAAASAQSRLPFYYRPLVDYVLSLPDHYLLSDSGEGRHVFRHAMKEIIPSEILNRTDKIGFQPPENVWIGEQREWAEGLVRDARDLSIPMDELVIPADIAVRKTAMPLLVRCLTTVEWAQQFNVVFD